MSRSISAPTAAVMLAECEGITDPEINMAITRLDRRLPYIGQVLPPLKPYVMARLRELGA